MKNFFKQYVIFSTLMLAGVLTRLLAAWRFRHMVNLDAGVVALMAKHIAEGRELPVFFYGQAHMGSLEALLSGLFCRLFGVSGFAVNLGTAAVSMGILPCVYFWAKSAAGRRAGLIALALCIIGPGGFFHYNGSPRGGYAAALTFGAFLLMFTTRMVLKWKRQNTQSGRDFIILGLAAGVAWWSSQLTTASIVAAAVLLVAGIGYRVFTFRIFAGAAGFFLGSLPLWWWNFTNDWKTFQFAGSFGKTSFRESLGLLFTERFLSLYTYPNWPPAVRLLFIFLVLLLVAAAFFLCVQALRRKDTPVIWGLGSAALFVMVFAGFFAGSHLAVIPTPRYVLPLTGPLCVVFGIVIAKAHGTVPAAAAALPVLLLIGLQVPTLIDQSLMKRHEKHYHDILEFGEEAEKLDLDMLYAPNHFRSWNFILREQVRVVDLEHEVYPPNAREAELRKELNVMEDYGLIRNALQRTGGSADRVRAGRWRIRRNFTPPPPPEKILPPGQIRSIRDGRGDDHTSELTSGALDHIFQQVAVEQPGSLTVELRSPAVLSGIRYWPGSERELPAESRLQGRLPDGDWVELVADEGPDLYYWSGPRLYAGTHYYRRDYRFAQQELEALRLTFRSASEHAPVSMYHLDLLAGEAESVDWPAAMRDLLEILDREGIRYVLADRWESNRIVQQTGGRISAPRAPAVFPGTPLVSKQVTELPVSGALLVPETYAGQVRGTLKERGLTLNEIPASPWTLFVTEEPLTLPGLFWNGLTLFKHNAAYGRHLWEIGLREEALRHHPFLARPDSLTLAEPFRFQHGIFLRDFHLSSPEVRAGGAIRMHYLWELPPRVDTADFAVFVHFYQEQNVMGDDRVLLSDIPAVYLEVRPDHGRYPVTRTVTIPPGVEPGTYHIRFGLYNRHSTKRLRVNGPAPVRKKAIEWSVPLKILSP